MNVESGGDMGTCTENWKNNESKRTVDAVKGK